MHIPVGYLNLQFLFTTPGGRNALTAVGMDALGVDLAAVQSAAASWEENDFWDNADDSWTFTGLRAIVGMTNPSEPVVFEAASNQAGGNAGVSAPPQVSFLFRKRTLRGGRAGRGRNYVPGVPNDYLTDAGGLGGAVSAILTTWTDSLDDLMANLGSTTAYLLHSDPELEPDEITTWELDGTVATQRRRLRG